MLVGLLGLVTIAGMGSCAAPVTLKTRPWPAGRPSTLGSSATNTLPCGSTVRESTTSYGPSVPSRNWPWLLKGLRSPVVTLKTSTLVLSEPGAGQVGGQPPGMDGPAM